MALVVGDNSYVTLEEAQDIVSNELYPDSPEALLWEKLDNISKEIVCKRGTMAINSLNYIGENLVWNSKLKFPRYTLGINTVPREIKIATVVNGLIDKLVSSGENYSLQRQGVKDIKIGQSSISFSDKATQAVSGGLMVYSEALAYIDRYLKKSVRTVPY